VMRAVKINIGGFSHTRQSRCYAYGGKHVSKQTIRAVCRLARTLGLAIEITLT